ncbi:MAG: winged helix-turn-helix transcriptional regulator [Thermoanaerobaculia bacterium]
MEAVKKEPAGNDGQHRRPNPIGGCPLTAALAAVGGKWKLIVVYWLAESPKHFAALRKVMPGISQKVLTQQLRELISDGIVRRHPRGAVPAPVEYSLTGYGQSLLPVVEQVRHWGRTHMQYLATQAGETHQESAPSS